MDQDTVREQLGSLAGTRTKVRLTREFPSHPLHNGFVVGLGQEWVLVHPFHDFYPEGFSALRVRDITELRSAEYERHWERMLAAEGLLQKIPTAVDIPLDNVTDLLNALQRRGRNVIVECEAPNEDVEDFYIGQILSIEEKTVRFANFDGLGRWDEAPHVIPLAEITRVQVETPYELTFSKYLEGPCPLTGR